MNQQITIVVILILSVSSILFSANQVKADTTIYIRQDGSILGTNLIIVNSIIYTFTGTITSPIVIEKNDITLDGAGYMLEGHKASIGINLTATNVTVKNIQITDWNTGILGAYNNNTIKNNWITNCDYAIKIYADKFEIKENTIIHNNEGIHLHGGQNTIQNNNITSNKYGIYLQGYASNKENIVIQNTITKNYRGMIIFLNTWGTQQAIYHNNFIQNTDHVSNTGNGLNGSLPGKTSEWNSGSEGNYWDNYNGTDINNDGIGDMPYHIDISNEDRFPLKIAYTVSEKQQTTSPTPEITPTCPISPTPTATHAMTTSPSNTELPTQSPQIRTISVFPPEAAIALAASIVINVVLTFVLIRKKRLKLT